MLRVRLDQNTKKISDWNKHFQLQINEPVFQIKEKLQLLGFAVKAKMMLEGLIFIRHEKRESLIIIFVQRNHETHHYCRLQCSGRID